MGGVQDRAAADAAEHQRVDVRLRGVDRVVGGTAADVGVGVPLLLLDQLPLRLVAGELARWRPVALLEADHREAVLRELLDGHGTGRTGTDHQHVSHVRQICVTEMTITRDHLPFLGRAPRAGLVGLRTVGGP